MTSSASKAIVLGLLGLTAFASNADAAGTRVSWRWTNWARIRASELNQAFAPQAATPSPAAPAPVPEPTPVATPVIYPAWWQPAGTPTATATPLSQVASAPVAAAPAPVVTAAAIVSPPSPTYAADAFVNMGDSGFIEGSLLTTGGAQPWYDSSLVTQLYNGTPDASQRADFVNTVFQRVESTYALSGVPVKLTDDPSVSAAHTLSVVSNTSYGTNANAIGITDIGNNGFSFIDKLVYAKSVDELEWAVAHNVAHELMHAFDVDHHDKTGQYLDAAVTPWNVLVDPKTSFSQAAVDDLLSQDFQKRWGASSAYGLEEMGDPGQTIVPSPVPEPTTIALWVCCLGMILLVRGRKNRRLAA